MKKVMVDFDNEIKELVRFIDNKSIGFDVFLGGGFLRDRYTDKTPKDLDIFFVPKVGVTDPVAFVPDTCSILYVKSADEISDMQARGVNKLVGLYCEGVKPTEVQFIIYNVNMNLESLVKDMDMNICQIMWDPKTNEVTASDEFVDGHDNKVIMCLHDYDETRKQNRYNRMLQKFPDYTIEEEDSNDSTPINRDDYDCDAGGVGCSLGSSPMLDVMVEHLGTVSYSGGGDY